MAISSDIQACSCYGTSVSWTAAGFVVLLTREDAPIILRPGICLDRRKFDGSSEMIVYATLASFYYLPVWQNRHIVQRTFSIVPFTG